MGGQDKALCKETMRTITSQNGTYIQPLGKWTRTGHIHHTAPLEPETGIFYVREETGWIRYINQTAYISTRFYPTYRINSQVEHPHNWEIIASIENTGGYRVR